MAYYSSQVGIIYHECLGCFAGNNIETVNMTEGQPPGARLCKICANLDRIGKCMAGIPKGQPSSEHTGTRPKKEALVIAYYSKLRPKVYHKYKNCNVGNNMVKGNLEKGRPPIVIDGHTLALCATCAALGAAGRGIPGIPKLPRPYKGDVVETYYSKERPEIFHMCQNCHLGQNIDENNLVANEPPLVMKRKKPRLCKTCARLCIAGKCITGTPIPAELLKSAYYSKAHPRPKIFHVCKNCYIGNNLKAKVKGEPYGARLCKVCYRLRKEGKCTLA